MNRLPLVLAAALAVTACTKHAAGKGEAAASAPAYVFPHTPHLEGDVPCSKCHAGIEKSTALQANVRHVKLPPNISKNDDCSGCHDTEPKITLPKRNQPFRLTFDHQAHLPRVKGDCKACHTAPPEKGDAQAKAPPMAACTACHNHQKDFAEARCTPCHTDLKGLFPVNAFSHQGDWLRLHAQLARSSAETCAQCHDQTYCSNCHSPTTAAARPSIIYPEAVERDLIHRGDYVSRHMIEAGANPASCMRCHGTQFCEACHTQQGVTQAAGVNARDPHPPGWANDRASGHFHGDAARRDIVACAGCHDNGADAICVACHKVGGIASQGGKSPHPPSFLSKHDSGDWKNNSMCRICHTGP